jgi:ribosomal-protein-alanine N-acetyltransferase
VLISRDVTFEDLAIEHLDDVLKIERVSFKTPWSKSAFIHEIHFEKSFFKVIRVGGQLVGYGGFWNVLDEAHISNIAIHPDYRRQGLGRILLTHLLEEATAKSATVATLEVRRSNIAAQRLYGSFGFKVIAVRKHYYADENEDALIMCNDNIAGTLAAVTGQKTQEDAE